MCSCRCGDLALPGNKYFNPEFMDYLVKYMLPSISLWNRILDGEFGKFSNEYRQFSINRNSYTTGHVEQHFGLLKQNKAKAGLDTFVRIQNTVRKKKDMSETY